MSEVNRKESLTTTAFHTLRDALDFIAGKTIERDMTDAECEAVKKRARAIIGSWGYSVTSGVRFTDGTMLVLGMQHGFGGSDVTPPDPDEVVWIGATPDKA